MVLEKLHQQERKYSEFQNGSAVRKERSFRRPGNTPNELCPLPPPYETTVGQTSVRRCTPKEERIIWLPKEQRTYEDRLILPGEMYKVTLNSMSSEKQHCCKPPHSFFLSKPGRPGKVRNCTFKCWWGDTWSSNAHLGCLISLKSDSFTKILGIYLWFWSLV